MLFGHQKQRQLLNLDLESKNLSHAYLITGPSGIGKFTLAKDFARQIQVMSEQSSLQSNVDVSIVDDLGESLKIEQVREICASAALTVQRKYKTILIKNIERLTSEAANAFLKTLEEPNPRVIFILSTSDLSKLMPTIRSRLRHINCRAFNNNEMMEFAESIDFKNLDKQKVIQWSVGRPAKLKKLIEDEAYLLMHQEMHQSISRYMKSRDLVEFWLYLEVLAKDRFQAMEFLDLWESIVALDSDLYQFPWHISQARARIDGNINTRLVLENLSLDFKQVLCGL